MRERCINRELTTEVIVGAFMMTVLLGLGYFTILLSREPWFQKRHHMDVRFASVMGLREGDSVVCRGMPVGKVLTLELLKDGVHVRVSLEKRVSLREDHRFTIVSTSILGGRQMEIYEGADDAPAIVPRKLYDGDTPRDIMSDASDLVAELKKSLFKDGLIDNLEAATRDLRTVTERIAAGKGTVGKLLAEDSTLYDDLAGSAASLKVITSRLENGEGTVGKLLAKDSTLYEDLAGSVASLKVIAARLERGEGTVGKLLSGDDTLYRDLAATAASLKTAAARLESGEGTLGKLMADDAQLYQDIAAGVKSLRSVAERLDRGDGLLGKLITDEELARDVKGAVKELRAATEDFRESSPVTTFTSIFFGVF